MPAIPATSPNRIAQGASEAMSAPRWTPVSTDSARRLSGALTSKHPGKRGKRATCHAEGRHQSDAGANRHETVCQGGQRQPPFVSKTEECVDVGRVEVAREHRRQHQEREADAGKLLGADPPGDETLIHGQHDARDEATDRERRL